MIERPVLHGAPVRDRAMLVMAEMEIRFNDGDMLAAEQIQEVIDRWRGPSCEDEAGECFGNCCDAWFLNLLVWAVITASQ